jgi:RNA polymerase sigma-70 factor (ECF subfamily)
VGKELQFEDDRDLVIRCQRNDDGAFEELVRKYQQTVFNIIYHNMGARGETEDVAQKIFSKVYFSLGKFDSRRPFFPWLYRIAINQCYDELRRMRRRRLMTFSELSLEDADSIDRLVRDSTPAPEDADNKQEMHALLHKLLDQLPEQQKVAVVMRDLEDVPYDKMAEILNCSEQAVRLKVFRGRTRLRELMEKALQRQSSAARSKSETRRK